MISPLGETETQYQHPDLIEEIGFDQVNTAYSPRPNTCSDLGQPIAGGRQGDATQQIVLVERCAPSAMPDMPAARRKFGRDQSRIPVS